MAYNSAKLMRELLNASLPVSGVDSDGKIDWSVTPTQAQVDQAEAIKVAHNPNTLLPVDQVRFDSKGDASSIPNYATWTRAQFQAWFDANLSDAQVDLIVSLADAKVMLKRQNTAINALAKMVIALRNLNWPDLQV